MENHISAHRMVAGSVMFGRGHQQVGILVEPHPAYEVAAGDEGALVEFRNAIWYACVPSLLLRAK